MVFVVFYPADGSDFDDLNIAFEKLTWNDVSVLVARERSGALGFWFRYIVLHRIFFLIFYNLSSLVNGIDYK